MGTTKKLEILLSNAGYAKKSEDEWLAGYILDEVTKEVLNFCNLTKIPDELEHVVVRRAAGRFLLAKISGNGLGDDFKYEAAVKELKEGDVSVSYSQETDYKSIFLSETSKMASFGEEELLCFRKLRW